LQENKFKDWKEDFPIGAELLTYLFRILLWAESDLQSIEVFRKIFLKTSQPFF